MRTRFITYEDRQVDELAVKLLALSVKQYEPSAVLRYYTLSEPNELCAFLSGLGNCEVVSGYEAKRSGYSIKAELLLDALDETADRAVWIDSDIILSRAVSDVLHANAIDELIVSDERTTVLPRGVIEWAVASGLEPRDDELGFTTNTCVVAATHAHRALLQDWGDLMDREDYRDTQAQTFDERPFHLRTDQDVLGALIGSKKYQDIQVRALRNSWDIAQCHSYRSYSLMERFLVTIFGGTRMVHAQGEKPWRVENSGSFSARFHPYRLAARPFAPQLGEADRGWLEPGTGVTRILERICGRNHVLAGCMTFMDALARRVLSRLKRRPHT